jgi:hypothetical protein
MNHEKIVAVASLVLAVDRSPDDAELMQRWENELAQLEPPEDMLVLFARKILAGKPYAIHTGDAQSVRQYQSLATYMGATWREIDETVLGVKSGSPYNLRFDPPQSH